MITFTEKEFNYCLDEFRKALEARKKYKFHDDFRIHLDSLDEGVFNDAKDLLEMDLDLEKVNKIPYINEKMSVTIYWVNAFWAWMNNGLKTYDEVKEYVNNEEYCLIFEKMMNK